MKFCLSFGAIDKNLIILQLVPITFIIVGNIIFYNFGNEYKFYDHSFAILVSRGLGKCLSFIPLIIFRIKNANSKNKNLIVNNITNYKKEYYKKFERFKLSKFLLMLISSILHYINNVIDYLIIDSYQIDLLIFDIILLSILSYIVMNIKLYKHQYFSILIIFIVGIIKNYINIKNPDRDDEDEEDEEEIFDWIKIIRLSQ